MDAPDTPAAAAEAPAVAGETLAIAVTPAPTVPASAAHWPASEAPASMNLQLKVGNMQLMYTARDVRDQDLQDRMTRVLPWLAEVMSACEANYEARQQAAKAAAEPS